MSEFKQNTEFVLQKVDSLLQNAVPYLEKGAEEVVAYTVLKFQVQYALMIAVVVIIFSIFSVVIKRAIKGLPMPDSYTGVFPAISSIVLGVAGAIVFTNLMLKTADFVISIKHPEMFTIMQLIGE